MPSAPEIDVSAEDIAGAITGAMEGIPQAILDNEQSFRGEVAKCGDDGKFEVPDTNLVLTKTSSDNEIHGAAIAAAFAGAARDAVKDAVWGTLEPTIDEQLNAVEGLPQKIKDTAKDKFKEKTVDVAVDKAMDEALEKAKNGQ